MSDERGNGGERKGTGQTAIDADGVLDGRLDDVLRRMTAVDDADADRSAARVLLRVRTQAQARTSPVRGPAGDAGAGRAPAGPPLAALPRLAWAAMAVCVLAGGVLWFAMRPAPSTSSPSQRAAAPPASTHVSARPAPGEPAPSSAPAATSGPATVARATPPSSRRTPGRLSALPDEGERARLPRVDPIAVAAIEPAPLPAPAFLTTTPVASESIEVEPIAVTPLSPSAQEPGQP